MPDFIPDYVFWPLAVVAIVCAGVVGTLSGAFITWLIIQVYQLRRELAALQRPRRVWLDEIRLDARTELLATAQLMKLSVHDGLDALRRISPQLAEEVVKEVMR